MWSNVVVSLTVDELNTAGEDAVGLRRQTRFTTL